MIYNKDRTMIACNGMIVRTYSYADLMEIRRLLTDRDVNNFDRDACLAMLPGQQHVLSLLMQNEPLFVELCENLFEFCSDTEADGSKHFLPRLISLI